MDGGSEGKGERAEIAASMTPEAAGFALAIVQTTSQPFLVLDADLRVEAVNPAFLDIFRVAAEEAQGRPLWQLGNGQWDIPELRDLLVGLTAGGEAVEGFRVEHTFQSIGRRTMLLNGRRFAGPDGADRILLAISDVTEEERLRSELEGQREFAELTLDALRDPILVLGWDLRVQQANGPFYERFQVTPEQTEGVPIYELGNGQWDIPRLRELLENILPDNHAFDDFEVEHDFDSIGHRLMLLNARRLNHHQLILLAIEDVTERRQSELQQRAVMGELQHRVKNILANVRGLARQTRLRSPDLETFFTLFDGRLEALARTQNLLLQSQGDAVPLDQLLRTELGATGAQEGETFRLEGPPVLLAARTAQAVAMTAHELTTNAAKYGALAQTGAHIDIRWRVVRHKGRRHLELTWLEREVVVPEGTPRRGFGMEVIERMLSYTLGGTSKVIFAQGGIECRMSFPLERA